MIDSVRPLLAINVQSHPLLPLTRNISFTSDAKSEAMTWSYHSTDPPPPPRRGGLYREGGAYLT